MHQLTELPEDDPNLGGWFIECNNTTCRMTTNIHFGEADRPLREKWNRRARCQRCETVLAGLPQDAIDGGWTAAGICAYAKRLEEQIAALRHADSN